MSKERLEQKVQKHKEICDELREIYRRKNQDYGDSFAKSHEEFGEIAGVIRMSDKMERMKSLVKKDERLVDDENFEDTVRDIVNYGLMLLMEMYSDEHDE